MAYDAAAVVAPKGLGPCCVRSLNAGDPTLPTSTFLGVPSRSSALSWPPPSPRTALESPGPLVGLAGVSVWLPRWSESLAHCCLGQPRTGWMKSLFVSLDQAQSPSSLLWQLLEAKTRRDLQTIFWRVVGATGLPRTWWQFMVRVLECLKLGQCMRLPSCTSEGRERGRPVSSWLPDCLRHMGWSRWHYRAPARGHPWGCCYGNRCGTSCVWVGDRNHQSGTQANSFGGSVTTEWLVHKNMLGFPSKHAGLFLL